MFGAKSIPSRSGLTKPAAATPTPVTSWPGRSSATAAITALSIASGSVASVARRVWASTRPESSTSPAAIFVPPMSTPIAVIASPVFLVLGHRPDAFGAPPLPTSCPSAISCGRKASPPTAATGVSMDEFHVPLAVTSEPTMSISDLLIEQATTSPTKVLIEKQEHGAWRKYTTAQVLELVEQVAKGLIASGVEAGDHVAIMSRTRFEWTILDFAIWHAGAVPVPVYETSSADQSAWILGDSDCVAAFVETAAHAEVVAEARAENGGLPGLRDVWTIDEGALDTMIDRGREVSDADLAARHGAVGLDDVATIIYTPGTTGRPKGAELTHGNFVELVRNAVEDLGEVIHYPDARTLLFMPLA